MESSCERPGTLAGEGTAAVADPATDPGLEGSKRGIEAWYHEESVREAIAESAVQLQQETPTIWYWQCQYHGTTTKDSSSYGVEPA